MEKRSVSLAICTEHLTKIYGGKVIAVNDMNLQVPTGSIYGLLGPNGAGKTTTLRLLLGLQQPTAGKAEVFGQACGVNATAVRGMIGFLPTHPTLPGHLRPVEYLELLGKVCRLPAQVRKPRLTSLLRAVGLLDATDQRIDTFSTGMRTRLGIAASLLADPPLLLWDEPTAGLDPAARRFTLDLIRDLGKTRTILVATHILNDIDQICDHVGVMYEGRMIFSGPMREMKRRLQRDEFHLEVEGPAETLSGAAAQAGRIPGVQARIGDQHMLVVGIAADASRASALAKVLEVVDAAGLTLQSIQSAHNDTEHAYLQLLQEDQAHGFRRFEFEKRHGADAGAGDSAV
jgi:ABC-2 type transport system ATP-binding protein